MSDLRWLRLLEAALDERGLDEAARASAIERLKRSGYYETARGQCLSGATELVVTRLIGAGLADGLALSGNGPTGEAEG